jgi:hypothetical protein
MKSRKNVVFVAALAIVMLIAGGMSAAQLRAESRAFMLCGACPTGDCPGGPCSTCNYNCGLPGGCGFVCQNIP